MSKKITVKLLVGDLMEIEVPDQVSYGDMYILIRESLPADIRPISVHLMNLMLGEDLVPLTCETSVIELSMFSSWTPRDTMFLSISITIT